MENKFLVLFLCVAIACFCSAEFSADTVYEILTSKMDILFFNIKNLRRDIDEINESARKTGAEQCKETCFEVKQMFESYKAEMNEKFTSLENKVTERVDALVQEVLVSLTGTINGKLSEADNVRSKERKQLKTNMRRFVSSEKRALRILNNKLENNTRKNIKNITDEFEIRIQNAEQSVALFTNNSVIRMEEVENKMFAFENASWKGERGDIGPTGQKGERGIKGEKGYAGVKGSKGVGMKGQKGERGYTGQTESRHFVYFHVSMASGRRRFSQGTIVKFDKVFTNEGQGYSKYTGKFTAPYSGAYLFLFFVKAGLEKHDFAFLQLYVSGKYRAYTVQESLNDRHDVMGGQAYVEYLLKGETAWIQTGEMGVKDSSHTQIKDHLVYMMDHTEDFMINVSVSNNSNAIYDSMYEKKSFNVLSFTIQTFIPLLSIDMRNNSRSFIESV